MEQFEVNGNETHFSQEEFDSNPVNSKVTSQDSTEVSDHVLFKKRCSHVL